MRLIQHSIIIPFILVTSSMVTLSLPTSPPSNQRLDKRGLGDKLISKATKIAVKNMKSEPAQAILKGVQHKAIELPKPDRAQRTFDEALRNMESDHPSLEAVRIVTKEAWREEDGRPTARAEEAKEALLRRLKASGDIVSKETVNADKVHQKILLERPKMPLMYSEERGGAQSALLVLEEARKDIKQGLPKFADKYSAGKTARWELAWEQDMKHLNDLISKSGDPEIIQMAKEAKKKIEKLVSTETKTKEPKQISNVAS
ncbi:hypothetical protein FRB96_007805 [Tulasnella sp. 330]|nr:hypothetical protein FRB96_007805 [Tulasnella sp. 330]KAG8868979.1 hypothetical protein FRB98_003098 [Tulasnella sp. 332]